MSDHVALPDVYNNGQESRSYSYFLFADKYIKLTRYKVLNIWDFELFFIFNGQKMDLTYAASSLTHSMTFQCKCSQYEASNYSGKCRFASIGP